MKLFVLAVLALFGHAAIAAKVPQPTAADQRIRQVVYSSSEVYEVSGSYRLTTTIEFEKGETVQYLTLGDTIAWQAHPMGHRVHLKPVEPRAVTNLTVVTDRRTYYFRLTSAAPKDKLDATYLLRFTYPSEGDIALNPGAIRKPIGGPEKDDLATRVKVRNCNYSVSGSRNVRLIRACDDGLFTYLDLAGIDRGYGYFAPNIPGSYKLIFELHYPDSRVEYALPSVHSKAAGLRVASLLDEIGHAESDAYREYLIRSLARGIWREHADALSIRAIFGISLLPTIAEFERGKRESYEFLYAYDFSRRENSDQPKNP